MKLSVEAGQKFNKWTVIEAQAPSGAKSRALCLCECGNVRDVRRTLLVRSESRQCKECADAGGRSKHGQRNSGAYKTWTSMKRRCFEPSNKSFPWYGGRGITVCDRRLDFRGFYADMGDRPDGMSIDRIDPNGNYEPANCRWANWSDQAYSRRTKWSQHKGVSYDTNTKRWTAQITLAGKQRRLGRFHTEQEAADAFSQARA